MPNVDDPLASLRLAYLEDLSDESPEDYEEESAGYVDDRARTMPREDRVKSVADHQGSSNMHRSSSSSLSKLPFPVKLPKTSKIAAASSVRPSRESLASQSSLVRSVEETSSPQEHRTRYPPATVQEASDKFRLSEKDCPAELGKPAITEHSQSGSLGKGARPKSRGQVVLLASEDPIEGESSNPSTPSPLSFVDRNPTHGKHQRSEGSAGQVRTLVNSKEVEKSLPLKGATEINETENAGSGTEIPLKPSAAGARQSRKNHTDQTDVQQEYLMPRKVSDHTRGNRTKSEVKHSAALEEEMQEGEKSDRSDIIYLKDDIKVPLQTSAIKENQDTKAIQELDTTKKTRTPSHSSVKKDVPSGKKGFVKIEPKKAEDIHVTGNNKVKVAVPIVETGKETEADMPAAARQNTLHHISHVEESPHTTESDDERTTMATSLTSATQDSGIRPRPKTAAEKKYKVTSATNRAKTAEAIESPVLETLETVTDKTEIRVVVPEFSAVPKGHQKAKPKSTKSPKVDETYNQTPIETAPGIVKDISKSLYIIEDGHFAKLGKVSIPNAEALRNTISVEREPLATSLSSSQAISPFHEHPKEVGHREQEIVSDAPTAGVQIPEITSQLKVKGKDHSAEPQPVKYYKSKKGPSSKKVDIRYGGKKRTAVLKDNPLEVEAIQNVAASLNPKVDVAQKEGASLTNSQNEYVQSGTNKEEEDMACFPGGSTFESIISPVELPRLSTSAQNQHAAHVSAPIKTDVTTPTKSILKRGPSLSSRPSTARITIKEDTYFNDDAIMSYRPQGPVVDVEKHTEFDIKTKTGALGKKAITLVVETPIKKIMVDSSTEMGDMAPSVTQPPPITLEKPRLAVAASIARCNTAPTRARSHSEPPPSKSLDSVLPRSILKDTQKGVRQSKEHNAEESMNSSRSSSPVGYTVAFKKSTQRLHFDPGVYVHFKEIDQAKNWQESKYKKKGIKNKILHFVAEPSVTHPPELGTIQEERSNATSRASTAPLSADERQLPSTELHNTESESVETSDMSENAQTSDDESLRRAAVISKSESLLDLSRTASMELLIKNSEENSRSPPRRSSFDAATQTPVLTPSVTRPQFERAANIVAPVEQLQKARISKNRKSSRVRILTPPKGPPPPKPKILPNKKMEIKEQPKYLQRYLKFAKDAYKGLKSKKIKVPLDHPLFAPVKPRRHHSSRSGSSASSAVSSDNEGDSLRKKKMTLKKGSRPKLDTRYPVLPKIRTDRSYVETMRPADGGVAWPPGVAAPGATYDWNQYGFAPSYLQSQPTQSGPSNLWDQNGPDGNMAEMQQHASSWIQPQAYYAPGPAWNAYPSYQWG